MGCGGGPAQKGKLRVRWLPRAKAKRFRQLGYISEENADAAMRIDEQLDRQGDLLEVHPKMGRIGRVEGTRELVIARSRFLLVYRIRGDEVQIMRKLHGAQQWPPS